MGLKYGVISDSMATKLARKPKIKYRQGGLVEIELPADSYVSLFKITFTGKKYYWTARTTDFQKVISTTKDLENLKFFNSKCKRCGYYKRG